MTSTILAIGKALPQFCYSQSSLAESASKNLNLDSKTSTLLKKLYDNSNILQRHSVVSNLNNNNNYFSKKLQANEIVSMSDRNAIYMEEAPKLALCAAKDVLSRWKGNVDQITHLITVTCTGIIAPGLEIHLAKALGLSPYTSLFGVNLSGCHGSFKALNLAAKICHEKPRNRVLVISTELCSLHFKPNFDLQNLVIQSLFADGSAAVILGDTDALKPFEVPLFSLERSSMALIDKTLEAITWNGSNQGFDMTLSLRVPSIIRKQLNPFIDTLHLPKIEEIEWAIHPGGKEIIEAVESTLQLDKAQTTSSWNVLNNFGNMSSASILFVLADIAERNISNKYVACIGFGPGITVEFHLLKSL